MLDVLSPVFPGKQSSLQQHEVMAMLLPAVHTYLQQTTPFESEVTDQERQEESVIRSFRDFLLLYLSAASKAGLQAFLS